MIKIAIKCCFLALLASIFTSVSHTHAQTNASAEDIAIAFYKTAGVQPPYQSWVKSQKPYSETPLARRPQILEEQTQRLAKLYNNFSPKRDVLDILTAVKLKTTSEQIGEDVQYFLQIDLGSPLSSFYLPYTYNDQNFMVIPKDFVRFNNFPLTEQSFNTINGATRADRPVNISMQLLPIEADFSQPYIVDDRAQWMMSARIVGLQAWTPNGQMIWQYSNAGFTPAKQREINELFQEKDVQLNQIIQPIE